MIVNALVLASLTPLALHPGGGGFARLVPTLPAHVEAALAARGISEPTPIQRAAIPAALAGDSMLLHAETGSGKSLAFLVPAVLRIEEPHKVLVVAPTRELAVQLANEAGGLLRRAGAVQIVAVGCTPSPDALLDADVICCTAPELLALRAEEGNWVGAVEHVLNAVRVLVLDELDSLLPIQNMYGKRAAQQKKAENKRSVEPPAQVLIRAVLEACPATDLQLLAASATVSRPYRAKLARVLRRDPLGRWFDSQPEIVRPAQVEQADLSAQPRAVVVPSGVSHMYLRLPSDARLRRATAATPAKRTAAGKGRPTLKQKRQLRAAKATEEARSHVGVIHPLLLSLEQAMRSLQAGRAGAPFRRAHPPSPSHPPSHTHHLLHCTAPPTHTPPTRPPTHLPTHPPTEQTPCALTSHSTPTTTRARRQPKSCLVFICRSSGLTVRRATRELRSRGLPATALHEAIGLEHDISEPESLQKRALAPLRSGRESEERPDGVADPSARLQRRHAAVAEVFAAKLQPPAGAEASDVASRPDDATDNGMATALGSDPLIVTFEDMARGLHFDGVENVFILGMPDSPATYLHLAGRTGRHGGPAGAVIDGTVVTICPSKGFVQLQGWAQRLGGIEFTELELPPEGECDHQRVLTT